MDKKDLAIVIFLAITFIYMVESVPYCYSYGPDKFILDKNAIYTQEQALEIKNLTMAIFNIFGNSMFPTINNNSQCLCVEKKEYNLNDIILFFVKTEEGFNGIIHRIVMIDNKDIYTKGDNNFYIDPPMVKENIVCYVPTVPRYKTFINFN